MCRVLNVRILNISKFLQYDRVLNMRRNAIMEGSEYSRIPSMPGFCVCKRFASF